MIGLARSFLVNRIIFEARKRSVSPSLAPTVTDGRVGFVIRLEEANVKLLPGMKASVMLKMPDAE